MCDQLHNFNVYPFFILPFSSFSLLSSLLVFMFLLLRSKSIVVVVIVVVCGASCISDHSCCAEAVAEPKNLALEDKSLRL